MYSQSSLRIQHLNYFNHVLELFKPYLSKDFELKTKSFINKKNNNNYSSVNFATLSLPCFNYYKNLFYNPDKLKIVPSNIQDLLSPRSLAYWIMDDGSFTGSGLKLHTNAFSLEELNLLIKALDKNFSIKASVNVSNREKIIV